MNLNKILKTVKQEDFQKPPDESIDSEEKIFERLFENQVEISEEEQKQRIKALRQRGFQISSRNDVDSFAVLDFEINRLKENALQTSSSWFEHYEAYIKMQSEKIEALDEQIKQIKGKVLKYDNEIAEHNQKKQQLKIELEELKKKLIAVRELLSISKKGVGEKLITDAEIELKKVVQLQKNIYTDIKVINDDRYKNTKYALDELIVKWKILRTVYVERFQVVNEKIKLLGGDGINYKVAYTLISLGSVAAGVAGYFFGIFSSKAGYSSDDVFYYLLKNIISVTINPSVPVYTKISYLLSALAMVTVISWILNELIKRANYHVKEKENNEFSQNFSANFKMDGLDYSYKTREKNWLLLWLKVVPLILVAGIIIILLSNGANIQNDTNSLSSSTEGLVIGTAIAMGLSAAVYIYITKITEGRMAAGNSWGSINHNWELICAISIFLISIVVLAFYRSNDLKHQGSAGTYSIIGFVGSCLITAFAFAYGLRFSGLLSLINEIENQIDTIDEHIARNSVPYQPILNLSLSAYFKELSKGLLTNLNKKNEAILNTGDEHRHTFYSDSPNNKKRLLSFTFPKPQNKNLEDADLFEIMEWELVYFPEHGDQLKVLAALYKENKSNLAEVETKLKNCISEKESKEKSADEEILKVKVKKDGLYTLIMKVRNSRLNKEEALKREADNEVFYLKDGFDLGLWYSRQEMGTKHYPLLLNETK